MLLKFGVFLSVFGAYFVLGVVFGVVFNFGMFSADSSVRLSKILIFFGNLCFGVITFDSTVRFRSLILCRCLKVCFSSKNGGIKSLKKQSSNQVIFRSCYLF